MGVDIGLLIVRLVAGGLFVGHGVQKLSRRLDGDGLDGTAGFLAQLGFPAPKVMATLTGLSEIGVGALLVAGLWLPVAAAGVVGLMVNAAVTVHGDNGLWAQNGGYEYPVVLAVFATALAFTGPGRISMATELGVTISGPVAAVLAIGAGTTAALLALGLRHAEISHT